MDGVQTNLNSIPNIDKDFGLDWYEMNKAMSSLNPDIGNLIKNLDSTDNSMLFSLNNPIIIYCIILLTLLYIFIFSSSYMFTCIC